MQTKSPIVRVPRRTAPPRSLTPLAAGRLRCGVVVLGRSLHKAWRGERQATDVLPIPPTGPCRPSPPPGRNPWPYPGSESPRAGAALAQPSRSPPKIRDQVVLPPGRIGLAPPDLAAGHTAAGGNENARLCGGGHRWAHVWDGSTSKPPPPSFYNRPSPSACCRQTSPRGSVGSCSCGAGHSRELAVDAVPLWLSMRHRLPRRLGGLGCCVFAVIQIFFPLPK